MEYPALGGGIHASPASADTLTLDQAQTLDQPQTLEQDQTLNQPDILADKPWVTLVWNDPVNLMSYVSYVFESYFTYSPDQARHLMLQVHHEGRAVVSAGSRERMEVDVQAMHSFGLWATMQRADSLGDAVSGSQQSGLSLADAGVTDAGLEQA